MRDIIRKLVYTIQENEQTIKMVDEKEEKSPEKEADEVEQKSPERPVGLLPNLLPSNNSSIL